MHSKDFISAACFDIFFDNSLSDINDQDLAHLESEIPKPLASLNKKNSLKSKDDINPIDFLQL